MHKIGKKLSEIAAGIVAICAAVMAVLYIAYTPIVVLLIIGGVLAAVAVWLNVNTNGGLLERNDHNRRIETRTMMVSISCIALGLVLAYIGHDDLKAMSRNAADDVIQLFYACVAVVFIGVIVGSLFNIALPGFGKKKSK